MNSIKYLKYLILTRSNPLHTFYLSKPKVLDVGCGEGEFLAKMPKCRIGVDIDARLVRKCVERGFVAHHMSALKLDFQDNTFDAVHAAELIEHFNPEMAVAFLAEASRVLKPGCVLYLTTPGERSVWNTFSHVKPYPPIAIRKLLDKTTEGFVHESDLPLILESSFSFSNSFRSLILTGLKRAFDIAFPPRFPSGYVIILRKQHAISCNN